MTRTYHVPRRFHPGHAALGRWLRRRVGDARRAEAYLACVLVGMVLLLAGGHAVVWALLQPEGAAAVVVWGVEAAALALCFLVGAWGHRPALAVACLPDRLRIEHGPRRLDLPYDAVRSAEPVSALRFHRHYGRYAATRAFVNRAEGVLALLHTADGPVVIGLADADVAALLDVLEEMLTPYTTAARVA